MNWHNKKLHAERMRRKKRFLALRAKGKTLKEIGEMYGISHQAVNQALR
jgi:DNA-directed RNA polymerase sigma subunit (sigma70/sigma32)